MRVFLIFILLTWCTSANAQQPFVRDLWYNDASLPVKTNAILQDDNGYIWLGTDDGIYRFNGRSFVLIKDEVHRPVTALTLSGNRVYVGYKNGSIGLVNGDEVHPMKVTGVTPATAITDMAATSYNLLWVATEGQGFIMILNNVGVSCNKQKGLSDDYVYNLFIFPNKRIVATTDQGVNEVYFNKRDLTITTLNTENGLPDNIVRVIKPMPDNTACWLGTEDGGLAFYCRKARKVWTPYIQGGWRWGPVNDIVTMPGGKAWVATENGYLLRVTTDDEDTLHIKEYAFPGKKLNKLTLGRSGVIWCATSQGISMVSDEYMQYIPLEPPYSLSDVRAMSIDKQSNLWYSLDDKLYCLSLCEPSDQKLVYRAPANITSLFTDQENRLWIGTFGQGLCYMDAIKKKVIKVTGIAELEKESVLDVTGTKKDLWVSGLNGVQQLSYPTGEDNHLSLTKLHNKHTGVGSDYVYQVYPDKEGRVWMATDGGGISMYRDGKYTNWNPSKTNNGKVIYSITEDAIGKIWVAALNSGLYYYNNKEWQQISIPQGLQDANVYTVAANATGQVVAVHNKGFDVWYPKSRQFRSYTNHQSFDIDSTSTILKLSANDAGGNVYIPFRKGFLIIKNIHQGYDIKPNVILQSIKVFFEHVKPGTTRFGYNENQLSFKYEGINFANPDKLHYRYKLIGYSNGWTETGDELVTFPQLPPGKYTFLVQASLNNSFNYASDASYSFTIASPFWRRGWFFALVIGAVFAIVYIYVYFRERNLKKMAALQSERMLFEYEHLKSQVNPHFLFNSLNTLASLIEEDKKLASDYTTHLSDFYRNMLAYRNRDLVALGEEWEILQNYLFIQKSRFGDALILVTDVPERLMQTKRIVPLSLQLLVENAIKHNIVSKTTPLTISITATDDKITVRNNLNLKMSKEKGSGLGLVNIKKRYNLLTDKNIYIGVSDTEYIVILPLL